MHDTINIHLLDAEYPYDAMIQKNSSVLVKPRPPPAASVAAKPVGAAPAKTTSTVYVPPRSSSFSLHTYTVRIAYIPLAWAFCGEAAATFRRAMETAEARCHASLSKSHDDTRWDGGSDIRRCMAGIMLALTNCSILRSSHNTHVLCAVRTLGSFACTGSIR